MHAFLDLFLHLDTTLGGAIAAYGGWVYLLLFVIVFCETGLVVTPFLPGDSLLFAAGTFAAIGSLDLWTAAALLFVAAVLGDGVNYRFGKALGTRVMEEGMLFRLPIKIEHIQKTQRYYERYGAKTVVVARFMPIVRTFAPFVAGLGAMPSRTFTKYNLIGAALWVSLFIFGGYFFGNIPIVRKNFEFVILGIIFISFIPPVVEYLRERSKR